MAAVDPSPIENPHVGLTMKSQKKHIWNPSLADNKISRPEYDIDALFKKLIGGDINALSQAITLIESAHAQDRSKANDLINRILPHTGRSFRIAITGAPGVGKSTFLENMGQYITGLDHKIAVLSIDPSSSISKGSILGDKTRMAALSTNPKAFIRPTAAGSNLGGIGSRTRETILLCEAAGYETIFIETVGVGQSETEIFHMADAFILLIEPGAGDELQGIKRGIMELADIILVTKAEVSEKLTNRSLSAYRQAIHILQSKPHGHRVQILPHDSLSGDYAKVNWDIITDFKNHITKNNYLNLNRNSQNIYWFEKLLREYLIQNALHQETTMELITELKEKIRNKTIAAPQAAQLIFEAIKASDSND